MTKSQKFAADYMEAYKGCRDANATHAQAHKTALAVAEAFRFQDLPSQN